MDEPVVNREMLGAEVILYFDEQGKTLAVRLNPENQTKVGEKFPYILTWIKPMCLIRKPKRIFFTGRKNNHGKQQQK